MTIDFHPSGARLLMEKVQKIKAGKSLNNSDIERILQNSDIAAWLKAYDSWIENVHTQFRTILQALHKKSPKNLNEWGQRIDFGLRVALNDTRRVNDALKFLADIDWKETEQKTLVTLPSETKIQAKVFATIDGFNGGMFREEKIFLSLTLLEPQSLKPKYLTHEFHHIGFEYWWRKHRIVEKYSNETDTPTKWLLDVFAYVVSEGLANALCSPYAIEKVNGTSESIQIHNKIIAEYEQNWDEHFGRLLRLLRSVVGGDLDNLVDCYEEFALDMRGEGHPIGHFVCGRMVQSMLASPKISKQEVIDLAKNPFDFFKMYNRSLNGKEMEPVPPSIIDSLDDLLRRMS